MMHHAVKTVSLPLCRGLTTKQRCPPAIPNKARSVSVRAAPEEGETEIIAVPLPEGATQPKKLPNIPLGRFGFVDYAERLNSRVAMIGFIGILVVELIANKGILQLVGFEVGSGLGFEF